jgi:hypothetical protein
MPFQFNAGGQLINPMFRAAAYAGGGGGDSSANDLLALGLRAKQQYAQQIQSEQQQYMQAQQLQMAHQAMLDRGQTSTQGVNNQRSPIGQSLSTLKQAARMSLTSGMTLDSNENDMFSKLEKDPRIPADAYAKVLQDFTTNRKMADQEKKTVAAQDIQNKRLQSQEEHQAQAETQKQNAAKIQALLESKKQEVNEAYKTLTGAATTPGVRYRTDATHDYNVPSEATGPGMDVTAAVAKNPALKKPMLAYRKALNEYHQLAAQLAPQPQQAPQVSPTAVPQGESVLPLNYAKVAGQHTQYEEGQVLHSPSTGRTFKVVHGQLMEIPNAG